MIADIFANTITNWNDPALAAVNEGVEFPDLNINPVHRPDESGTSENLTDDVHIRRLRSSLEQGQSAPTRRREASERLCALCVNNRSDPTTPRTITT